MGGQLQRPATSHPPLMELNRGRSRPRSKFKMTVNERVAGTKTPGRATSLTPVLQSSSLPPPGSRLNTPLSPVPLTAHSSFALVVGLGRPGLQPLPDLPSVKGLTDGLLRRGYHGSFAVTPFAMQKLSKRTSSEGALAPLLRDFRKSTASRKCLSAGGRQASECSQLLKITRAFGRGFFLTMAIWTFRR